MKIKNFIAHRIISNKHMYELYKSSFRKNRSDIMDTCNLGYWYRHTNNIDPIYYVFRFDGTLGVGALSNFMILLWTWAKRKGYVPVILTDWEKRGVDRKQE